MSKTLSNRLLLLLPLSVFVVVAFFAFRGLSLDQSVQPSNLIDKPVPQLALAPMPGLGDPFGSADFEGQVTLVNVFGSWCAACRIEHDNLMRIGAEDEVPLYGINWADTPARGAEWLERYGNPYDRVGNDEAGRAVIAFGVTGAPETFVIDQAGRIRYRHVGPLTAEIWERTVRPLVLDLKAGGTEG
jgi:cytochrome c biogenesis protein CcmG/thiol:disulfide interchange protein DsbE